MGKRIGRRGRALVRPVVGAMLSDSTRHFWRRCLFGLVSLFLICSGLTYAASYVYDSSGRVIAVTRSDGTSAQYIYDNVGNLQQIVAVPAGQLAIFGFDPDHGSPGASVTIAGQGFSTTASANSVAFNGVAAPVVGATTSSLSVSVPQGATTGPISVSVGSQNATSAESFVIDGSGQPPVITSFNPTIAAAGSAVTVSGQNLDPVSGQTSVAIDGQAATPTSIANGQISVPVPGAAGSGHISVETPYGLAISNADLIVTPSGVSPAAIATEQRISVGGMQSLSIPAAGDYGVLLFDASNSTWLSFQLNALATTANNVRYSVYDPQNHMVVSGVVSTNAPSIHLPRLRLNGTYSIYFQPDTAAATLTVGLEAAPVLTLNAVATTLSTSVANQSKRYVFSAAQGQTLALSVPSAVTAPSGGSVAVSIVGPSYTQITNVTITSSGTINLPNLVRSGLYQVLIAPPSGATQNVSFALVSGTTGTLVSDGPSLPLATTVGGVNAYMSFTAAAGDNLELALSSLATSSTSGYFSFMVYGPTGAFVTSTTCFTSSPGMCSVHLWGLAAGTYSISVVPYDVNSTIGFTATLTHDVAVALPLGQALAVNLTRPGQAERMSFSSAAGQTFAINISALTTTPAGNYVYAYVYDPDGTLLLQTLLSNASSTLNFPNLSTAGNYTVILSGYYGVPTSGAVTLLPGISGTLTPNAPSQSFTTAAGQNAYLSFNALAGDNLELALSGITGGNPGSVTVSVYDANGNSVASQVCGEYTPQASCNLHLWGLAGGVYSVTLANYGATGFTTTLTRDGVGTLTVGQTMALNLTVPGQTARLSFSATAGQTVGIAIANMATTPSGNAALIGVYDPNGALVQQMTQSGYNPNVTLNLPNLAITGTYTVVFDGQYGLPTSAAITLLAGVTGSLTINGPSQSYSTAIGQTSYLSFTALAGDNLELALSGVSPGSSNYAVVAVYDANGNSIGSQNCYEFTPQASCNLHLWGLAGGDYSVTVASYGTSGFSAALTRDGVGTLTPGQPVALNLALPGQTARLSFNATAGQTVGIAITNMVTTPSGSAALLSVYDPGGSLVQQMTVYGFNPNVTLNLPNLATTGVYTIIFDGQYGLPVNASIMLAAGVTGSLAVNGASQSFSTTIGQASYLNFTAPAGSNLELGLSGLVGGSSSYLNISVTDANGNSVTSADCFEDAQTGTCGIPLWGLAGGTYSVTVMSEGTTGFTATLTSDVTGVLTIGQTAAVNLTVPGQTSRLSFSGTAGQAGTLTISGLVTNPTGNLASVSIYSPSGAVLLQTNVINSTDSISIASLAVTGIYTVIFSGCSGEPLNASLTLQIQ